MRKIQGKSTLVRVSEGSSYRESTVFAKFALNLVTLPVFYFAKFVVLAIFAIFVKTFICRCRFNPLLLLLNTWIVEESDFLSFSTFSFAFSLPCYICYVS